jgi:hypothetical protein
MDLQVRGSARLDPWPGAVDALVAEDGRRVRPHSSRCAGYQRAIAPFTLIEASRTALMSATCASAA